MKSMMPGVIGNRKLCEKLGNEIISGTLSHAYIIVGPKGSGKHTLAKNIAAALACKEKHSETSPLPCRRCLNCEKIFGGISPDVYTVGIPADKATIGVDTVRELRFGVLTAPNDTDTKVYIIENADKMTEQAQNAFLLTLEEPPSYVLFLLLCERSEDLLETVRSRAPILRMETLTPEQIEGRLMGEAAMAELKKRSPDEFYETVMSANGVLGTALSLSDPKARGEVLENRRHAEEFTRVLCSRSKGTDLVQVLSSFPKGRTDIADRLGLIVTSLRDLCVLKKSEDAPLCFYYNREQALELSDGCTASFLMGLADECEKARLAILRSANVKLTLLNLVTRGNHGK